MLDVKDLYKESYIGKEITVSGWIKSHRKQAHFGFIDLSDGTCFKNLQVVYDDKLKRFDILITSSFLLLIIINFVHIYSSIQITGFLYDTGPKIYTQIYYSILAISLYCTISFFDYSDF